MARVTSTCLVSIALLELSVVMLGGGLTGLCGVTGAGGMTSAGGVTGAGEVNDAGGVNDAAGVTDAGGVTSVSGVTGAGSLTGAVVVTGVGEVPRIFGIMRRSGMYMEVICTTAKGENPTDIILEDLAFPHFSITMQSKSLTFTNCKPRSSYANWLAASHYCVDDLEELHIVLESRPQATYFTGLPIKTLGLALWNSPNRFRLNNALFSPLENLTKVIIRNVELLPLPASSQLQWMSIANGRSIGAFGGCSKLLGLNMENWEVPEAAAAGAGWLAHCPQIGSISLRQMTVHMQRRVLFGTPMPKTLEIQHTLPYLVTKYLDLDLAGVKRLNFAFNKMLFITIYDVPESLEGLDLSNNDLKDISDWWKELQQRPALEDLSLAYNPLNSAGLLCAQLCGTGPPAGLRQLSLSGTGARRLCFGAWNSFKTLALSNNNITKLELLQLPSAPVRPLTVILSGNPIHSVPVDETEYFMLLKRFDKAENVLVLVDVSLECDCEHAWFARALRSLPNLEVKDSLRGPVRCSNGKRLVDTPAEQLECERFPCEGCVCRRAWSDNTTVAHCGGGLRIVPRVPELRALHAAGNRINTLHDDDLPETLLMLDLSNNQIMRLNESVVNKLFSVQERRVWLAGNPLDCECDNRALLAALQQHRTQVADYSDIVCVGSKQALYSVVVGELCTEAGGQVALMAILVASGVLVAFATLAAAVYCRYERQLRIFLYARGWCLCCMQEDDADDDRPYDAFISFAHADERLVIEQLLPKLERAPLSYKLCVHFRDWQPGEMIPTQIRLSVERSRRTVVILSRNFLQSMWAMLEFRTAHESAISDGRVRVVVIVLDDVVDNEGLDAELRGYLRTHTYLRWGDPWFWDKLRYALPHRRNASTNDARHIVPQPGVTGDVNMSPHDLHPVGTPGDVNLSLRELQPVDAPCDGNLSLHELQLAGAPSDINLLPNELQPLDAISICR